MKKFDFVQMLEAVQKYKITTLTLVPPIVVVRPFYRTIGRPLTEQALAKSPLTKKYDLSSVVEIGSGAAPLGGDVILEAEALWPEGDRKLKVSSSHPTFSQRKEPTLRRDSKAGE